MKDTKTQQRLLLTIFATLLFATAPAFATETSSPTEPAPPSGDPYGNPDSAADQTPPQDSVLEANEEDDESRFSWFSLSPQIGYAFFPEASLTVEGMDLKIDARNAFVGKLHLDLGGDGIALEIVPFFAVESSGGGLSINPSDGLGGGLGGDFVAVGGQMSIVYRFGSRSFFPHIGLGFHGAYLVADTVEYGAEIYGRIPLGFTWYAAEHFGLVLEVGFLYGATGIKGKTPDNIAEIYAEYGGEIDPDNPPSGMTEAEAEAVVQDKISDAVKFGSGFGFDFLLGIRFP